MADNTNVIWRYYWTKKIPVLTGAKNIHNRLFEENLSISKYGEKEAELLTKFFTQYKQAMKNKNNIIENTLLTQILGSQVRIPELDFTKGGNASVGDSGGIQFEKEIQFLLDKSFNKNDNTAGSQLAYTQLYIGEKTDGQDIQDFLQQSLGNKLQDIIDNVGDNFIELFNQEEKTNSIFLKMSALRNGKIDVQGNGNLNLEIIGEPSTELLQIINILKDASFSLKSYLSNKSAPHLGRSNGYKAVAAAAEYTGTLFARGAALYYAHHPMKGHDKKITPAQKETEKELYQHYEHMKKAFELTGMGLTYSDLTTASNVDFLLVNNARGNKIAVYSTRDLLNKIKNNRFTYNSIYKNYNLN